MSIKPTIEIDPTDIVRYLLYQQFYYGGDKIYGRTKEKSESIPGVGIVIEAFYNLINTHIDYIETGQPKRYLQYFHSYIYPIPVQEILNYYAQNQEEWEQNPNRLMMITTVVGQALVSMHSACFKEAISELQRFIKNTEYAKMEDTHAIHHIFDLIQKKLEFLYAHSDPDIGLLYSLSFCRYIAEKTRHYEIREAAQHLLNQYIKLIAEKLRKITL